LSERARTPGAAGPGAGRLSIVATPIGNLEDITLRALSTLRSASLVLAEDTRRTRALLTRHGISARTQALHAHTPPATLHGLVELLADGARLALVTDAGTPLVSDPGGQLVQLAVERGIVVEPIPGPSAVTAALTAAAMPFASFRFAGFVPRAASARLQWLARIADDEDATVFFESPQRLAGTLGELAAVLAAERPVAVCRELTKLHEEVVRGTATQLASHFAEGARGEITVVVAAGQRASRGAEVDALPPIEARITTLLSQGLSTKDVARTLVKERGGSRRELYAQVQALAKGSAR